MAVEIAHDARFLSKFSRLGRPVPPFSEVVSVPGSGWTAEINVRGERPIHIGTNNGRALEVWEMYIKTPEADGLRSLGQPWHGWSGDEVKIYKGYTYKESDGEPQDVEPLFVRDRRDALDMDVPLGVVDMMFARPERGIPRVEYIDTAAGRVIKKIHFE